MTELTRRAALGGFAAAAITPVAGLSPALAAAPPIGKQVPGFYRYTVGTMEVTAVTDGSTSAPLPDTYVTGQSKDIVNNALAANFMPRDRATTVFTPIVVNTGPKLVVIDTGFGPTVFEQSKGMVGQFQTNLAASGIDRNNVDLVIISHFHPDHISGLVGADGKPHYPNAEVTVSEDEWKYWMDDGVMSRAPDALKPAFQNVRRVFGVVGIDKVTRYQADKELAPGIRTIATPGHTPGHTSYMLTSGSDRVLVQVDITAGMAFLFVRNPDWQFGFDSDKAQAVETRKKMYEMAVADRIPVQGFHFVFPGLSYVEKDGGGYRLVPAIWKASL